MTEASGLLVTSSKKGVVNLNQIDTHLSPDGLTRSYLYDGRNIQNYTSFFDKLRNEEKSITYDSRWSMLFRVDEAELRHGILKITINPVTIMTVEKEIIEAIELNILKILTEHLIST